MIRFTLFRLLICLLYLSAIPAFAAAQTAGQETPEPAAQKSQSARAAPVEEPTFNLNFSGGTLAEYVELLRRQSGGKVNVIVMPDAASFPMPPMSLTSVTVSSAIDVLENRMNQSLGRFLTVKQTVDRRGGESIYAIDVLSMRAAKQKPVEETSSVWSLTPLTNSGRKTEDVIAAIETALSMFPEEMSRPQIRLHKETELLIARGDPSQLAAIGEVLLVLGPSTAAGPDPSGSDKAATSMGSSAAGSRTGNGSVTSQIAALQREIEAIRTQVKNLQNQVNSTAQPN